MAILTVLKITGNIIHKMQQYIKINNNQLLIKLLIVKLADKTENVSNVDR